MKILTVESYKGSKFFAAFFLAVFIVSMFAPSLPFSVRAAATTLTPTGIGNYNEWAANTGTKTDAVATSDVDVTYIKATNTDKRQSFSFPGMGIPADASINSVTLYAMVRKTDNAATKIFLFAENGTSTGNRKYSPEFTLSTSYASVNYPMATNPFTTNAWTATEVNSWTTNFGVELSSNKEARVTQIYIVVDYTLAATPTPTPTETPTPTPTPTPNGNNGAVWTTTGSCGDPQDANEYAVGEHVFINGANFDPGSYGWDINTVPPSTPVASGTVVVGADGSFCFDAHTIQPGEDGVYKASVDGKSDNYHVNGSVITPTPTPTETPTPTPTPTETPTPTPTPTETVSPTPTPTETVSPTPTPTESVSPTPTPSEGVSPTPTPTETTSPTPTPSETASPTPTPTDGGGSGGGGGGGGGGSVYQSLTIVVNVNNTHGGTKTPANFIEYVTQGSSKIAYGPGNTSGTIYSLGTGSYVVTETDPTTSISSIPDGYTRVSITGACDASGSVTLNSGESKTCVLTYEDSGISGSGSGTGSGATPTPEVAGASTNTAPTPTPEVLGASTNLPATGMSLADRMLIALFVSCLLTGMLMVLAGYNRLPRKVMQYIA